MKKFRLEIRKLIVVIVKHESTGRLESHGIKDQMDQPTNVRLLELS